MDDTQRLIARQVAFKGAIEILPEHVHWLMPDGSYLHEPTAEHLVGAIAYLTDKFTDIILERHHKQ